MFLAACCRPSREEGVPLQGSIQGRAWGGSRCSERRRRGCRGRPSTWQSTIVLCYHPVGRPATQYLTPTTSRSSQSSPTCHRESSELSANAIALWCLWKITFKCNCIPAFWIEGGVRNWQPSKCCQYVDFLRPTSIWWVPLFWWELAAADWGRWRHQQRPLHCFEADNLWSETSVIRENTTSGVFDW